MIPLAELSVVGSYGRRGYRLREPDFGPADLEVDLSGQRHLVTGASSGIGLAAAKRLSGLGATVVLVGRDVAKLEAAAREVPGAELEVCDLSDLAQVERLAARCEASGGVDVLIHNAGFIVDERRLTPQGHESAFATHVLAPFVLTHRLSAVMAARARRRGSEGRVIWVSSGGMYTQKLSLERAQALTGRYDGVRAYAQHKRAQVLLSESFDRHFAAASLALSSNAMHPGWVDTPGVERGIPGFHRRMRKVLRSPEQGADTIVWLAASPKVGGRGLFYLDRRPRRTELFPWTRHGEADREALWRLCCELTGIVAEPPRLVPG